MKSLTFRPFKTVSWATSSMRDWSTAKRLGVHPADLLLFEMPAVNRPANPRLNGASPSSEEHKERGSCRGCSMAMVGMKREVGGRLGLWFFYTIVLSPRYAQPVKSVYLAQYDRISIVSFKQEFRSTTHWVYLYSKRSLPSGLEVPPRTHLMAPE